jgi:ubiquinone/menaquinone biosynthesis C-methylase UbiE
MHKFNLGPTREGAQVAVPHSSKSGVGIAVDEINARDTTAAKDIRLFMKILNELGYTIGPQSTILDFGCDKGNLVYEYRKLGFHAFGADITLSEENDLLRRIDSSACYRIPFEDETFDFVSSNFVFEHVADYSSALSEIWRVLKPGGYSLHIFPPKYIPIEPHIFVPFAGVIQSYAWLLFWAFVGIRNSFQKDLHYKEVAKRNFITLRKDHNYLSKRKIREHVLSYFQNITFAEEHLIKHSYGYARYLYPIVRRFSFVARVYSAFHCRVIVFKK